MVKTGKEFNEKFPKIYLVKPLGDKSRNNFTEGTHTISNLSKVPNIREHGWEITTMDNLFAYSTIETIESKSSGLFTTRTKSYELLTCFRMCRIPDDALVYIDEKSKKYYTTKFILGPEQPVKFSVSGYYLSLMPENYWDSKTISDALDTSGYFLFFIPKEKLSRAWCDYAIKLEPYMGTIIFNKY